MTEITTTLDMDGIPRPSNALYDEIDRTSILYYGPNQAMRVHFRGGVCWPTQCGKTGFILLAGQDVVSKRIYVFEEREFIVIDHHTGPDGCITHEGISAWLNNNRATYYADTYYTNADEITHKRYAYQVLRSPMIEPKPWFPHVHWTDDAGAIQTIWEQGSLGKLHCRKGGTLDIQMRRVNVATNTMLPGAWALMAAVNGLIQFPWRQAA